MTDKGLKGWLFAYLLVVAAVLGGAVLHQGPAITTMARERPAVGDASATAGLAASGAAAPASAERAASAPVAPGTTTLSFGGPVPFETLTLLSALCGGLGAVLHALGSLVVFVGNDRFSSRWAMWYAAQPVRGAVLASGMCWVWYGGLLNPSLTVPAQSMANAPGLMFMVGLFSDPAIEKLREVFLVLFRTAGKRRGDALDTGQQPVIERLSASASGSGLRLEIEGTGFGPDDEVTVDGQAQPVQVQTATQLVLELAAPPAAGSRLVVVVKPAAKGATASTPASIRVP